MLVQAKSKRHAKLWVAFLIPAFVINFAIFLNSFLAGDNLTMGFTAFVCMLVVMVIYQLKTQISTNNFNKDTDKQ